MAARKQTVVELPRMQMRAAFVPSTYNDESRTIELTWSTGARVLRGFWDTYYEELSMEPDAIRMDRLNSGAPVLNAHSSYSLGDVIGVVEKAWIEDGEGRALVRFSDREDVAPIVADVKSGILRNISVGYSVHRFEQVEGGDEEIPVYRAVDWEPHEISVVPIPADAGSQFRSADTTPKNECVFIKRGAAAATGGDMATKLKTEADKRAKREAEEDKEEEGVRAEDENEEREGEEDDEEEDDASEQRNAGIKAERARVTGIYNAVRSAGLSNDYAAELVGAGVSVSLARKKIIGKLAEGQADIRSGGGSRVETQDDARDKFVRGVEASIIQRAGLLPLMRKANGGSYAVEPGEFRGLRLFEIARDSLERSGVKTRGMDQMTLIGKAFTNMRSNITQSTSDFGIALENVMHKVLQAAYATQPDTWQRFAARGSVSDFRVHNRYRMGMFGKLDTVNENGEFKRKPIKDAEKATIQADTVGNIINLSRQAIVNDDLGVFASLATALGRAARLSVEIDVYALLAENGGLGPTMEDGKTLFHADHGNIAGTAAYPSVVAFDAARQQLAQQKDPWGNEFLDLRPALWLGPLSLGSQARLLNDNQYNPDVTGKFQVANTVRGIFNDVIDSPRLTGNPWYVFADPGTAPVLEVAFLDGQESPVLESQDGWNVDGTEWKVRFDYGVAAVDYRGAVRNAGANAPA